MNSAKNYFVNKLLLLLFYTDHVTPFTPFRLNEKLLCSYFLLFSGRVCKATPPPPDANNVKTLRNLKNVSLTKTDLLVDF